MVAVAALLNSTLDGELSSLWAPLPHTSSAELSVTLGVSTGLVVVFLGRITERYSARTRSITQAFADMLKGTTAQAVFPIALMSSLAEELFFRGFLQPRFGLVITAVIFGVVHVAFDRRLMPWWQLAAIVMGLMFGWLMELTGTILAPFLAHFTINFFNLHHILGPTTSSAQMGHTAKEWKR